MELRCICWFLLAYGGFPPSFHALFIAERRHNHDTRIIADEAQWSAGIRTRYNSVQHVFAQSAVAIFGTPRALAALSWVLGSLLKGTTGERDRTPASQMWGQLFTERANRPAVGSIDETVGEAMQQVEPETSYLLGVCADAFFKIQCSISLCVVE